MTKFFLLHYNLIIIIFAFLFLKLVLFGVEILVKELQRYSIVGDID